MTNRISRLFLTGGSGFVGRNLIRHYVAQGIEVVALVRSDAAETQVRKAGATPLRASLLAADLATLMQGCDLLVHAAADTAHGYASPAQWQVNVTATQHLFAAAKLAGIPRAVHISTESVLLNGQPLTNASEDHPYPRHFAGAYSASKARAEQAVLALASDEFVVTIVRPRFVWGRDDSTALPQLVAAVQSGKFAWISGGRYLTSTTHIDNLCAGVQHAASRGANRGIYFITDGEPQPFRDFVTRLLATQGITPADKQVPRWLIRVLAWCGDCAFHLTGGRIQSPLNQQVYATSAVEVTLNIDRARKELGYQPAVTTQQGMAELEQRAKMRP